MTEGVNFSGKMAKEIKLEDIKAKVGEADLALEKKTALGGIFDTSGDSKISTEELAEGLDKIDLNRDGTLTEEEMNAAYDKLSTAQKQKVAKNEYIAYLKAMSAQNTELVKDKANVGNAYVIQLGEQFDDLIIRAMKSNGVAEDKCKAGTEEFNQYVARFKKDNAGAFATNDDGSVKWLYAGTKVYLNTDTTGSDKRTQNQDNKSQVEADYRAWVSGGRKGFTYEVDANGNRYQVKGGTRTAITSGDPVLTGTKEEQIAQLGLRETDGTSHGWYFDNSIDASDPENADKRLNGHYKWDDEQGKFVNVKGVWRVNEDGTVVVLHNGKEKTVSLTNDYKYTIDDVEYTLETEFATVPETESESVSSETEITQDVLSNRTSNAAAKSIAQTLYNYADDYSGDTSVKKIRDYAKNKINKDNVVEVWEYAKDGGGVQTDDASLIATMTSENISNDANGGRDMAVQTCVHIMKKLIERAKEVGVKEAFISDMQYWVDFDYTGWINDTKALPGCTTADDDDLGDLLEPKIDVLIAKIKENEALLKADKSLSTEFTEQDANDFAEMLYGYADDYSGGESISFIHKQVLENVNKDNVAKIWKASLEGNVQDDDASLIATMTSESTSKASRTKIVEVVKHIMSKLVEKAKELGLDVEIYNDVEEAIKYDYEKWIKNDGLYIGEAIPGNVFVTDDDLGDWLEPRIDALIEAIEEAEASQ